MIELIEVVIIVGESLLVWFDFLCCGFLCGGVWVEFCSSLRVNGSFVISSILRVVLVIFDCGVCWYIFVWVVLFLKFSLRCGVGEGYKWFIFVLRFGRFIFVSFTSEVAVFVKLVVMRCLCIICKSLLCGYWILVVVVIKCCLSFVRGGVVVLDVIAGVVVLTFVNFAVVAMSFMVYWWNFVVVVWIVVVVLFLCFEFMIVSLLNVECCVVFVLCKSFERCRVICSVCRVFAIDVLWDNLSKVW